MSEKNKYTHCDRCGKRASGGRILRTERHVCSRCYGQLEFEGIYAIDDGMTPETYLTKSGKRPQRLVKSLGPLNEEGKA